jgi:lysophospholipase L1-like esterase
MMDGEIDGIAAKVAVPLGTNDIGWLQRTATDTMAGIDVAAAGLHLGLRATKILLVGLLPNGPGAREATADINPALAARYGNGQVPYVTYRDISPTYFKNGVLDSSLFSDPQQVPSEPALHPSPEGQERMAGGLEPTLSELVRTCGMTADLGRASQGT